MNANTEVETMPGAASGNGDLPQDLPVVRAFHGRGFEDVLDVQEEPAHVPRSANGSTMAMYARIRPLYC